ncbi:MAG TPA: VTT domain-containing protein [Burkholderiaceae bacterium]|nr:VTT domain-containing protein [Burkholderiaceae bacterium]
MDLLRQLIGEHGLLVVFVGVLLEQGGLPLPAYPLLIVAAALAWESGQSLWPIVASAVAGALMADLVWFAGGRRFGGWMLRLMCRLSLSPDSCVSGARGTYTRWGAPTLIVAKFVPGLAAVATTMAGQMRLPVGRFLFYDGIGALLWATVAVALGVGFHDAVADVLALFEAWGRQGLLLVALLVAVYLLHRWLQRRRFVRDTRIARISVDELQSRLGQDGSPLILDIRDPVERSTEGWIPGALLVDETTTSIEVPAGAELVVYCDCPNEASAAQVALQWKKRGHARVRPLAGGFDAWREKGFPVQREAAPAAGA